MFIHVKIESGNKCRKYTLDTFYPPQNNPSPLPIEIFILAYQISSFTLKYRLT